MLKKAKTRATIATTAADNELFPKLDLTGLHTLAVLSYDDSSDKVKLFDAMNNMTLNIKLDDFKLAFDGVYQAIEHKVCN